MKKHFQLSTKFITFVQIIKKLQTMTTQTKKTTAKKTATKKSVAKPQTEPQKVSKTWLAMQRAIKDPWIKVNDWRAVNR